MGDLPGPELKPMSPALAGRFLTVPPGKSQDFHLNSDSHLRLLCVCCSPDQGFSIFFLEEVGAGLCSVHGGIGDFPSIICSLSLPTPISILYLPTSTTAWGLSPSEALVGELGATGHSSLWVTLGGVSSICFFSSKKVCWGFLSFAVFSGRVILLLSLYWHFSILWAGEETDGCGQYTTFNQQSGKRCREIHWTDKGTREHQSRERNIALCLWTSTLTVPTFPVLLHLVKLSNCQPTCP